MSSLADILARARARQPGTDTAGNNFSETTVSLVWLKAAVVPGKDSREWRKDAAGAWIQRSQYGRTAENGTGWEIDHTQPAARGGTDALANLQPLQWQNNRGKGDTYPFYGPWAVLAKV